MKFLYYLGAPAATIFIVYASLMNTDVLPEVGFNSIDKVYHLIAYFMLTLSWYFYFYQRYLDREKLIGTSLKNILGSYAALIGWAAGGLCFFIGTALEFIQGYFTNYRSFDYWDMLANATGIVIALGVLRLIAIKSAVN